MVKLSKLLMLLFIANSFHYSSQESKEIELQYVTRTTSYSNGESRSSSKMQWKLKEESKWQDLGKKFSIIEPTLNQYQESKKYLDIAKSYQKKYNYALFGTIAGTIATIPLTFLITNKLNSTTPNPADQGAKRYIKFVPFLAVACGGGLLINHFKVKKYENLGLSCREYNKKVNSESGMIQSLKFGLGFNNIPNTTKYGPQFSINIGLR